MAAIGKAARARGYFTREEFLSVCDWKQRKRKRHETEKNSERDIREATQEALSSANERGRIEPLVALRGVSWPTASCFLHFGHADPYPILDRRALQALGVTPPAAYGFQFWWDYVHFCREAAARAGLSMRDLDRALWQYSKEQGITL
jgi:hypothetical protein